MGAGITQVKAKKYLKTTFRYKDSAKDSKKWYVEVNSTSWPMLPTTLPRDFRKL